MIHAYIYVFEDIFLIGVWLFLPKIVKNRKGGPLRTWKLTTFFFNSDVKKQNVRPKSKKKRNFFYRQYI